MFNQAAYSCSHYVLCTHLHLIKPPSLWVEGAAYMFNQAAYSYTHHFCAVIFTSIKLLIPARIAFFVDSSSHNQAVKSLQIKSSANLLNQAAYSCTHHLLWSYLHIGKPQSLQVGSAAHMFNQAAYSCTHSFLLSPFHIVMA